VNPSYSLNDIMTCWRNASVRRKTKVTPSSDEGVRDVVAFYDILMQIEKKRAEDGKPPKLEFIIKPGEVRSLDLHRIIGFGFEGQIQVRCSPMLAALRADYAKKIACIKSKQDQNDEEMKTIKANMGVLSSFLFILARARMHQTFQACNPEVEATSSLGLVGIKTFRNFISESVLKAEQDAFSNLGMLPEEMRKLVSMKRDECRDSHQLQMRCVIFCLELQFTNSIMQVSAALLFGNAIILLKGRQIFETAF